MSIHEGDLSVIGALSAGNIAQGSVLVTPTANSPTSTAITGLDLQGSGGVYALTTPLTTGPGNRVVETSTSSASSSGVTIWIYRTNTVTTRIYWMLLRSRT